MFHKNVTVNNCLENLNELKKIAATDQTAQDVADRHWAEIDDQKRRYNKFSAWRTKLRESCLELFKRTNRAMEMRADVELNDNGDILSSPYDEATSGFLAEISQDMVDSFVPYDIDLFELPTLTRKSSTRKAKETKVSATALLSAIQAITKAAK